MVTKMQPSGLFQGEPVTHRKEIWAVGGGKGGTGKTFLAANLGLCLSKLGKRVLLVDADLGCANLHTALGMSPPSATLSDFLKGKGRSITDILIETGIPNLSLISGAQDFLEIANPRYSEKLRLIRQIQELDFEYIILDLGAGTSFTILDFFLISDHGILTVLPEPTSIENVYRFIKSAFYRRFKKVVKDPQIKEIITLAMDQKNEPDPTGGTDQSNGRGASTGGHVQFYTQVDCEPSPYQGRYCSGLFYAKFLFKVFWDSSGIPGIHRV